MKYYINDAKLKGFEVELQYIGIESKKINFRRVDTRVSRGGHSVDQKSISNRYDKSYELLSYFITLADRALIHDNTKEPYLVLKIDHCKLIDIYKPIPNWINENVNKKLYPDLYREAIEE